MKLNIPPSLRVFFKRNEKYLIIIGALILFSTFVTKDVLWEQLRATSDSIYEAETAFLLRDTSIQLHREIDEVDANLVKRDSEILDRLPPSHKHVQAKFDPETALSRSSVQVLRANTEAQMEFDNVARLIQNSSPDKQHLDEFYKLYNEWKTLDLSMLSPFGDILANAQKYSSANVQHKNEMQYLQMLQIKVKLQMIAALIFDDSQFTLLKKERLLNIYTPVSYVLYIVGSLLTLITKLVGTESMDAPDI